MEGRQMPQSGSSSGEAGRTCLWPPRQVQTLVKPRAWGPLALIHSDRAGPLHCTEVRGPVCVADKCVEGGGEGTALHGWLLLKAWIPSALTGVYFQLLTAVDGWSRHLRRGPARQARVVRPDSQAVRQGPAPRPQVPLWGSGCEKKPGGASSLRGQARPTLLPSETCCPTLPCPAALPFLCPSQRRVWLWFLRLQILHVMFVSPAAPSPPVCSRTQPWASHWSCVWGSCLPGSLRGSSGGCDDAQEVARLGDMPRGRKGSQASLTGRWDHFLFLTLPVCSLSREHVCS